LNCRFVGLFDPLKTALSEIIDPLIQTKVARIRKFEWLLAYVEARKIAFIDSNIFGG